MPVRPPRCRTSRSRWGRADAADRRPVRSGKSTLALAIAGLVPRDFDGAFEGSLEVDGTETRTWEPAALSARVGIVFQDPESQLVMERVEDDVAFGLENRGWLRGRMLARVPEALRGRPRWLRAPEDLPAVGRRAAAGRARRRACGPARHPRLDEPTANLDPGGTADFFARLAAIKSQGDTSIVLVEHRSTWPGARGPRPGARRRGPADRPRASRRGPRALRRAHAREGIWLPERSPRPGPVGRAGQPDRPDPDRGARPPLRLRPHGPDPARHRPRRRASRADRARRPQRQRQVDARAPARRPPAARPRDGAARRRRPVAPSAGRAGAAGGIRLPGPRNPVPHEHGGGRGDARSPAG